MKLNQYLLIALGISFLVAVVVIKNITKQLHETKIELERVKLDSEESRVVDSLNVEIKYKVAENNKLLIEQRISEERYAKLKRALKSLNSIKNEQNKRDTIIISNDDKYKREFITKYLSDN